MRRFDPLVRPVLAFLLLYGLLLAPWPGLASAYGRYFRAVGRGCFAQEGQGGLVRFQPAQHPPRREIDTEILVAAQSAPDSAGRVYGKVLGLDSRGVGWVPTALLTALVLASPVPWGRRLRALGLGLGLVHGYLLTVIAVYLWRESAGQLPVAGLPYLPALAEGLEETLVTQMGFSFVVPVVLWLAVTFRRDDWGQFLRRGEPGRIGT